MNEAQRFAGLDGILSLPARVTSSTGKGVAVLHQQTGQLLQLDSSLHGRSRGCTNYPHHVCAGYAAFVMTRFLWVAVFIAVDMLRTEYYFPDLSEADAAAQAHL